jgi:hypothetical protein
VDAITPAERFVERHRDKSVYFPKHNYVTYISTGQYYHCDWMSEGLEAAGFSIPSELSEQLASHRFDYIIGDFTTSEMSAQVRQYYELSALVDSPLDSVWVPKY